MAASWECPSLPMLSLPLKDTAKTSFLGLKPLISAHYEENPNTFSEEIRQLDQLREHATHPTRDYNGCSVMRRYFAQLHLLRARFPPETVGQIPVDFVWKDAYSGVEYIQEGFQIEQASILYNIAALHAQLGSHGKRDTEQEMKEAVTHFQCSAGALTYLDEHFAINHASKDLSTEFVSFYHNLMLGQAQECLVEKSLKGIGRVKNATIGRLATRVSEFYSRCVSLLEGSACNVMAKKHKDWPKLLKFKILYHQAIAHFYQGAHAEELGKYGELIALTQLTVQKLNSITGKPPKGMGELMKMARQNFAEHVTDKLAIAKRQNEQVYHDNVPQIETLELMSGADLVKPVSFHPTDPKNLGTDIFARLIPMRAHEVASIYSEEKAKLMRSVISSVEEKDEELEQYMMSLNANEVERIHEGPPDIPSNVLEVHQSLQGRVEEVRKLHSSCQELMAMSRCVDEDFAAIEEMKKTEEAEEDMFQRDYGVRPLSQVCVCLWVELENYSKYNTQASKSNAELKTMFDQHYPNLVLLTSPLASLKASLPKMTLLDTPAEDASESERWQHLLKEVEKMTKQRQVLVSRFREQMSHDDITKNLVGHLGNDQEVFMEDHMKQFKELATVIRQNLTAQENILIALTEANAKKASTRQTVQEIAQQQQAMFASLIKSGGMLKLLQTKIQEGIGFYRKLQGSVSRLRKRAEEVCDARKRERYSIQRKRSATPESPASPSSVPQSISAPARPPKKPELAGKPLHPDQQILTEVPHPPSDSTQPPGTQDVPLNAHPSPTQPDLQELQKVQMQQQALLGGLKSPNLGEPPLGELQSSNVPSHLPSVEHPAVQQVTSATPQAQLAPPSLPVTDATQALNSLQMLLNPVTPSMPVISAVHESGGGNANSSPIPDPSQIPQRPPKPTHLKSGLLPSPFPSLPILGEQSSTLPQGNLMEPLHPGGLPPPGAVVSVHSGGTPPNLYPGVTSLSGVLPEGSLATTTSDPHQPNIAAGQQLPPTSPPLQPSATDSPPSLWLAQTTVGGSSSTEVVLYPDATDPSPQQPPIVTTTVAHDTLNQAPIHNGLKSQDQPPVPAQSSFYQSNINIQPGQITVATSSILGPIPSTLAVPPSTQSVMSPIATPPAHTGGIPSAPSVPPTFEPLPQTASQPSLEGTVVANGIIAATEEHTVVTATTAPTQPHYTIPWSEGSTTQPVDVLTKATREGNEVPASVGSGQELSENDQVSSRSEPPPETNGPISELQVRPPDQPPQAGSSDTLTQPSLGMLLVSNTGASPGPMSVPASGTDIAAVSTSVTVHSLDLTNIKPVENLPGVLPLPLTSLSSLTAPHALETPTDSTPLTTELLMESLAPTQQAQPMSTVQIQLLQQNIEDQRKAIEIHRGEKEAFKVQEMAYQQQIMQLQQQLNMLHQKQDQEKVAATDQQSALMQLLHQQQGMFSQQQSQMEKLSQQDESHRKEYLHVEERFREMLRVEQEMKSSLQNQIMQLTQENQKLNQTMQTQGQQMQTLQLQLQQYSVHIQERDKQLVAFKDQHKEIVEKLEQKTQQKVAQLVQKIQELQLELTQRRDGAASLPRPLQPTVVHPMKLQQSQDLGPSTLQPNLPQPMQPNVTQILPPGRAPPRALQQHSGGVQSPVHPSSIQRPMTAPPPQGMPAARHVVHAEAKTPNPPQARQPSSQALQAPSVPLQVHPQSVRSQGYPATGQPASPMMVAPVAHQLQLQPQHGMAMPPAGSSDGPSTPHSRVQGQVRSSSIPSQQPSHGNVPQTPNMQSAQQMPSPHQQVHASKMPLQPTSHTATLPNAVNLRPTSHPSMQTQPFPTTSLPQSHQPEHRVLPHQQLQHPAVFQSPSEPSLQQARPQQIVPHSMRQDVATMQPMITGQRFPTQGGPMMRPNLVPGPGSMPMHPFPTGGQMSYGDNTRAPGLQQPQYRGHVP